MAADVRALIGEATGIGVYTRSLLLAMAQRDGLALRALAHRPPWDAAELTAAGIAVEQQAAPLGVVWQQLVLPRRLRQGDVDLFWSPLMTLPLRCPVPAVATVHDLTALLLPESHRWKVRASIIPFLQASLEGARRLVAVSRATAADIAFHFPHCASKVRVIYNGVDPEFRPGAAAEIAATRAGLGAEEDGYLLYAGTLEPRKNVGALLDAWESLHLADPRTPPLVLAGPYGWGSRGLMRRIESLASREHLRGAQSDRESLRGAQSDRESIRGAGSDRPTRRLLYLGRVPRPQLVRLFQAARLFVYPSLYEGFGLPPAEALACGVPAIACRTSSLPEVVGDAGLLVEPGDPGALAAAIQRVLGDAELEAELRRRALPQAARFRWDAAARAMEEVFREALE